VSIAEFPIPPLIGRRRNCIRHKPADDDVIGVLIVAVGSNVITTWASVVAELP
jgi:hypothetical protein